MNLPDLNSSKNINNFIHDFYQSVLSDSTLAPIFNKRIGINLQEHLSKVSLYWQKMLLGDPRYANNMIKIHRQLNLETQLSKKHYHSWQKHFVDTALASYSGAYTDKAIHISGIIIKNMKSYFTLGHP